MRRLAEQLEDLTCRKCGARKEWSLAVYSRNVLFPTRYAQVEASCYDCYLNDILRDCLKDIFKDEEEVEGISDITI
jgi:hypothetical protein